jgi:hypothetical protein
MSCGSWAPFNAETEAKEQKTSSHASPAFTAQAALAVVRGDKVMCTRTSCRLEQPAIARATDVFGRRQQRLTALYRKRNTSKKASGRTILQYLVLTLAIMRANQSGDGHQLHIPMARSFVYLAAVIDYTAGWCWLGERRSRWTPSSASR